MKRRILAFVALAFFALPAFAVQNIDENGKLPRKAPEAVGVDSKGLEEAILALDSRIARVDGLMVLRDGAMIAEAWRAPFGPDNPHPLYSLSKSFASTAVGFAVQEGKLTLDCKIADFFPDDLPETPDPKLGGVELKHLLNMTCGHAEDFDPEGLVVAEYGLPPRPAEGSTWARLFLERPIVHEPGTTFVYNTGGMYIAAGMIQNIYGETLNEFLGPRLYEPLKIDAPFWELSPQGIAKGGTGLALKLEDVAKFGQFYLQRGEWNGERLLDPEWVDRASSNQLSDSPDGGYGYQFWRNGRDVYFGMGSLGQFCIIMPTQRMVVAIESDVADLADYMGVLFGTFIPALKELASADATPDDGATPALKIVLEPKEGTSGSCVFPQKFKSETLKREVSYLAYVPNEYKATTFSYPLEILESQEGEPVDSDADAFKSSCDELLENAASDGARVKKIFARAYVDRLPNDESQKAAFIKEFQADVQRKYRCK